MRLRAIPRIWRDVAEGQCFLEKRRGRLIRFHGSVFRRNSRKERSAGVVNFGFGLGDSTKKTGCFASSNAAVSSVTCLPAAISFRYAERIKSCRKTCGVSIAHRRDRSSVERRRAFSESGAGAVSLIVSVTRRAREAAPCLAAFFARS